MRNQCCTVKPRGCPLFPLLRKGECAAPEPWGWLSGASGVGVPGPLRGGLQGCPLTAWSSLVRPDSAHLPGHCLHCSPGRSAPATSGKVPVTLASAGVWPLPTALDAPWCLACGVARQVPTPFLSAHHIRRLGAALTAASQGSPNPPSGRQSPLRLPHHVGLGSETPSSKTEARLAAVCGLGGVGAEGAEKGGEAGGRETLVTGGPIGSPGGSECPI